MCGSEPIPGLVSVVVPVFNAEPYLCRCLQSIKDQTYENLEIILVDDGSTDSSGLLCDEFAANELRARVVHKPNEGPWTTRNLGQDLASGEYLYIPDADDFFHPDTVRLLIEAINRGGQQYPLSICRAKMATPDDPVEDVGPAPQFTYLSQEELLQALFYPQDNTFFPGCHWNKLYRVSALQDLRSREYKRAQDRDFQTRLYLRIDGAMLVEETLYYWVQRPLSLTKTEDVFLRYGCVTDMTYRTYRELEPGQYPFKHYFLHFLYKRMVLYKDRAWKTDKQQEVFSQCKEYERRTRRDYLTCGHENILVKLFILTLVHCPLLTRSLMILTHNR